VPPLPQTRYARCVVHLWVVVLNPRHCCMGATECEDAFCSHSHKSVAYDRTELARLQAFLVYADFLHAVSVLFGPKFLWQYEAYMERLYDAYGADRKITVRRVRVSTSLATFVHILA
jgi:hypothetical protein